MILNAGQRTDIPGFFSRWFINRVKEKFVFVRSPYAPQQLLRYRIEPEVVDILSFCTKNPAPMLPHLEYIRRFPQIWQVTITPYGKEIEPGVPEKSDVIKAFQALSMRVRANACIWRYDPVFLSETYSAAFHREAFAKLACALRGFTTVCVVSFIDLYEKTKRNFPQAEEVPFSLQRELTAFFAKTAADCGMRLKLCAETPALADCGADVSGCLTQAAAETAVGFPLAVPASACRARKACACLLGGDIGEYNSCPHGCLYCYANADKDLVRSRFALHNPDSPLLIGVPSPGDIIRNAEQHRWRLPQTLLPL